LQDLKTSYPVRNFLKHLNVNDARGLSCLWFPYRAFCYMFMRDQQMH
jgi:hypothetical protein